MSPAFDFLSSYSYIKIHSHKCELSDITHIYNSQLETLILANHILHYHQVLDAYGHVSVRHPDNPDVFM